MSKKDRLKAQAAKQRQARLELEEQEREEREQARRRQSRSARKILKKAERGRYGKEPLGFIFLKLLMLIPFAYSGIYWGGIQIFGMVFDLIEPKPPAWVFWSTLAGVLLALVGVVMTFFKKYIPSFVTIAAGTGLFLRAAQYFIDYIQQQLETRYVEEALRNMDKEYMQHLYPMGGVAAVSLMILVWWAILKILAHRREQRLRDTAPVKSIVDE